MTNPGTDFLMPEVAGLLVPAQPAPSASPASCRARRRVFPGDPGQVPHVRRFVRRSLAGRGPAADAALLATELATNAIQHTSTGDSGAFEVVICLHPAIVRICVTDQGSAGAPVLTPAARESPSGRGLAIVDALARRWGHQANGIGRTVWFELDSAGAAPGAGYPGP